MAPTTSAGSRTRPMGVRSSIRARHAGSSIRARVISVSTCVGATALTRMPSRAHSTARARVRLTTPPFEAA
jgi:hypothetical protein